MQIIAQKKAPVNDRGFFRILTVVVFAETISAINWTIATWTEKGT